MKTILLVSSFVAALAASASLANATPSASETTESQATRTLAVAGQLTVATVGDYVHAGSYRIWVSSHMGQPDHVLPDGTWIYGHRHLENSSVECSVAISFENGRVSTMRLLSPATVTALLRSANPASERVAKR